MAAMKTVRDVAPTAEEIPYTMTQPSSKSMVWKLVRYGVGGENVVGIGTLTGHALMFFYRGRELDDKSGLLQGGGKDTRFIRLNHAADAERPEVRKLTKKAFALARSG